MSKYTTLSSSELQRYARHIAMPEFSLSAQNKLKQARVLVVGAGGLGCPVLLYLAAAGVGKIGIIDDDKVSESNLQRQVLYQLEDTGKPKVAVAKKRLLALNPHIEITTYQKRLTRENALEIINDYDIVADGSDNFPTRYLVNDACVLAEKVNVFASVLRFEGQVSVFNFKDENGTIGPNYRDIFPEPPAPGQVPNCAEAGVLGVLPGIIGSMQANEVIKIITGIGEPLAGRYFLFDAVSFITRTLKIQKNPTIHIKELIDYEEFCGFKLNDEKVKAISVQELQKMQTEQADFQLLDVREIEEYNVQNIGGELMPLSKMDEYINCINRKKKVVIHCKSGARSRQVIQHLEEQYGFQNLYNLEGGMDAFLKI